MSTNNWNHSIIGEAVGLAGHFVTRAFFQKHFTLNLFYSQVENKNEIWCMHLKMIICVFRTIQNIFKQSLCIYERTSLMMEP